MPKAIKSDGCWGWHGAINKKGYAFVCFNGVSKGAHRVSYLKNKGEIPKGMYVLHSCDNPPCTNPDHLFLGTAKDNVMDMDNKGRRGSRKGIFNASAKLKYQDVREIRKRAEEGEPKAHIAREFNVSPRNIDMIIKRETWK